MPGTTTIAGCTPQSSSKERAHMLDLLADSDSSTPPATPDGDRQWAAATELLTFNHGYLRAVGTGPKVLRAMLVEFVLLASEVEYQEHGSEGNGATVQQLACLRRSAQRIGYAVEDWCVDITNAARQ